VNTAAEKKEQNPNALKRELFKKTGANEVGGVTPVQFEEFKIGHLKVRHTVKDTNLVIHMFWEEPPPPGSAAYRRVGDGFPDQPVYAMWPKLFRDLMYQSFVRNYRLEDQSRLEIVWVGELASWCVTVKAIASIVSPPSTILETTIREIIQAL
jgi:hypothetical protein